MCLSAMLLVESYSGVDLLGLVKIGFGYGCSDVPAAE